MVFIIIIIIIIKYYENLYSPETGSERKIKNKKT